MARKSSGKKRLVPVTVKIDEGLREELREMAKRRRRRLSAFCYLLLEEDAQQIRDKKRGVDLK
jgi:mRNA-degrading endonuclease RelE of RelBE toxin-antitoxin system